MGSLFDENGNGDLDVTEVEHMVRDLATMRMTVIQGALAKQMSRMDQTGELMMGSNRDMDEFQRKIAGPGQELIEHYKRLLAPGGSTRAAILRQHLDVNHDGRVKRDEFVWCAP